MSYRRLLLLAFLFNGLLMIGMKAVEELGLSRHIALVLVVQYGVSAILCIPGIVGSRKPATRTDAWVGVVAGLSSAAGMTATLTASTMIPGYMLFPIIQGGTMLAVVIVGRVVFKERVGAYGIAGLCAGVASIILLSK